MFAKNHKKGFTLIELLVVIAIVGLLSSIVMASLNSARKKSRDARRKADLHQILTAIHLYASEHNGFYPGEDWCDSSIGSQSSVCPVSPAQDDWNYSSTFVKAIIDNGYMPTLPVDPINSTSYYYDYEPECNQGVCPSGCCYYRLRARLEQGGTFTLQGY